MKRLVLFAAALLLASAVPAQNKTFYYERVAQVTGGKKTAVSGDGHYLTINNRVIYESKKDGTMAQYATTMNYLNSDGGLPTYEGRSYLGSNLIYRFAADYSRLNVVLADGTVLVYERKSQPTAAMMRGYVPPATGDGGGTPSGYGGDYPSPKPDHGHPAPKPGNDHSEVTCVYCNGTGRQTITQSINVGGYGVQKPVYTTCSECGYRYDSKSTSHRHQTCARCGGRGKQQVR